MKWDDIKTKSQDELQDVLAVSRSQLIDLRFRVATGGLKQVHQIEETRRRISRLLTRLAQLAKEREK